MKDDTRANCPSRTESVEKNTDLTIDHSFLKVCIPQISLHRILHKDLSLKAYRVQLIQELKLCQT